jgi:fructokinase
MSPRDLDVLSFGEALVDFFPTRPGLPLEECDVFHRHLGGAPANVAIGLARLGARAGLMTLVGPDAFGTFVRERLAAEGVDTSGVGVHRTAKTGVTFVSVGAHGERSFLFFRHPSADQMIAPHDVDASILARARFLHVGSSTLSREPARAATLVAIAEAKRAGCLVSTDPNWRPHLWENPAEAAPMLQQLVSQCDVVKVSDDELAPLRA